MPKAVKKTKKPTKKKTVIDKLLTVPKKDKGVNMPRFQVYEQDYVHQADLMYLPNDNGYKYLLVVVDVGTRLVDAVPLKSKSNNEVLKAFKTIYKRKTLSMPIRLEVDSGSEFKGTVKHYFEQQGVFVRVAKIGRHRQQAIVEKKNQMIQLPLFKRMHSQEYLTGETSVEWVDDLPEVLKELNKNAKEHPPKKLPTDPVCAGSACEMLTEGTKVRVQLEEPRNVTTDDKKLHRRFRATDIRWDPDIRIIKQVVIEPGKPPMYLLDGKSGKLGIEPIGYTKNQLQVVDSDEGEIDESVIRGTPKYRKVEKIIGKLKKGGVMHYKVKWLGLPVSKASFEPVTTLREDIPELLPKLIKEYEDSRKKK